MRVNEWLVRCDEDSQSNSVDRSEKTIYRHLQSTINVLRPPNPGTILSLNSASPFMTKVDTVVAQRNRSWALYFAQVSVRASKGLGERMHQHGTPKSMDQDSRPNGQPDPLCRLPSMTRQQDGLRLLKTRGVANRNVLNAVTYNFASRNTSTARSCKS